MAQDGDTDIFAKPFLQHLLDVLTGETIPLTVAGAFRDNHNAIAPARSPPGSQPLTHPLFPVVSIGRTRRNQRPIRSAGKGTHQGEIPAVSSHDLDHKSALVACRRAADGIDGLGDAMQGGISTDSHISAKNIVVDRAGQSDESAIPMTGRNLRPYP